MTVDVNKTIQQAKLVKSMGLGRVLPNQTVIYHQGDDRNGFYRVNSGVIMVYRLLEDCQRQIAGFFTEGDYFGLSAGEQYSDTAVTVSTSNIVKLTLADMRRSSALQKEVFEFTCGQLGAAQRLITTLTKKDSHRKNRDFPYYARRTATLQR